MPETQEGLSDEEVEKGYCLSCITTPLSDLDLDEVNLLEGLLPEVRTIPAKISKLKFLADDIVKVTLRTPPNKSLEFLAGQYIDISIKGIKRSYSVASTPSESGIELLIKNYSGGQFSNYLFNEAKVNDLLRIEGPKGAYILPKEIPEKLLFVSTGTGIAPNLSLIKSALSEGRIKKNQVTLIHGQRTAFEHVYQLEDALKGIEIIKSISRESRGGYIQGYVQDVIKGLDLNMKETMVFACGNPQMIKKLKLQMSSRGLEEKNFKSDGFVPSN
jgi:CDP-4-dehydro-6-deoxyglucose reductase